MRELQTPFERQNVIPFGILWLGKQPGFYFGSQLERVCVCVHALVCVCLEEGCFVGDEGLSELRSEGEKEENTLRGDGGSNCSEQSPVIGRDVIQCKSTLKPVYSLSEADMCAFLITLLSFVI